MSDRYIVPGVDRALSILELLATRPGGLSMMEIAARTGFPNNSVYRIAMTLCRRGYVRRSRETKRFAIADEVIPPSCATIETPHALRIGVEIANN